MMSSTRVNRLDDMKIAPDATLIEALATLERGGEAIAFVCDEAGRVLGTLTDGDVRRAILGGASLDSRSVRAAMHTEFVSVPDGTGRAEVLDVIRARRVEQIPILDADGRLCGLHTVGRLIGVDERPNTAVILAGGRGTRLAPITHTTPKPMVLVAGRPILERIVLHLMSCGIRQFYLSVNYLSHIIEEHFGDGSRFGCHIEYLRESMPLGTGGPLSLLSPAPTSPVLVLNGDLVTQCDVGALLDYHSEGGFAATIGLRPYTVQIPFGTASVEDGRLVALHEKPIERRLINAGIYALSPEAIQLVPLNEEFPITMLFERCLQEGRPVGAHLIEDDWADIGRPEELTRARGIA